MRIYIWYLNGWNWIKEYIMTIRLLYSLIQLYPYLVYCVKAFIFTENKHYSQLFLNKTYNMAASLPNPNI